MYGSEIYVFELWEKGAPICRLEAQAKNWNDAYNYCIKQAYENYPRIYERINEADKLVRLGIKNI